MNKFEKLESEADFWWKFGKFEKVKSEGQRLLQDKQWRRIKKDLMKENEEE